MLTIWGIEATQAIQYFRSTHPLCTDATGAKVPCRDNTVPLVANKPTTLRLFVSGATPGVLVGGVATVPTSGGPYGSTFRVVGTGGMIAKAAPATRTDPTTTLQVSLPPQRQGTYAFDVLVTEYAANGGGAVAVAHTTLTLQFVERRSIRVRLVRIRYKGRGMDVAAPTVKDFWDATDYAQCVLPIPNPGFLIVRESMEVYDGDFTRIDPSAHDQTWPGYAANRGTTGNLLNILDTLAGAESLPADVIYIAIYPDKVTQSAFSGWAVSRWIISDRSGETLAHEILHKSGVPQHAPCGGPANVDPNYPDYPTFSPLPAGSIGEVGFDGRARQAHDPSVTRDLMTYCAPRWISPYNYTKAFNSLPPLPPEGQSGTVRNDKVIALQVVRFPDRWTVVDLPHVARPLPPWPIPPRSAVVAFVLDAHDAVLNRTSLAHTTAEVDTDEIPQLFECNVPWHPNGATMELRSGRKVLARILLERQPVIDVRFPDVAELEDGRGVVTYRVVEAGETVAVAIRVSQDGGATWSAVVSREREGEIDISPLLDTANECLLEVLASSGYHTADVRAEPFRVRARNQTILAWSSAPNGRVASGERVALFAISARGATPASELTWYSDHDGDIGVGACITATLKPGRHMIEVRSPVPFERPATIEVDVA